MEDKKIAPLDKKVKGLAGSPGEFLDPISDIEEAEKDKFVDHENRENELIQKGILKQKGDLNKEEPIAPLKTAATKEKSRGKTDMRPGDEQSVADPNHKDRKEPVVDKGIPEPDDQFPQGDELIYSKGVKVAPRAEKAPIRDNAVNQIHNGVKQVSLKAAIKEKTNPVQVNAKQMEDDSRRQQEIGNQMNEEVQKASDEEQRIREERELEQMHREESAAEMRAMETLATGAVTVGILDAVTKETGKEEGLEVETEKPGLFSRLAGMFKGGKSTDKEEIIEDGLAESKGSSKGLNLTPGTTAKTADKIPSSPEREALSANMEKFLEKSDAKHSLSAPTKSKKHDKGHDRDDDSLMPTR